MYIAAADRLALERKMKASPAAATMAYAAMEIRQVAACEGRTSWKH